MKFNWPKLNHAIEEQMHVLPDLYQYKNERTQKGFKKDMGSFLRQLVAADPQATLSAAQIYQDNHYELDFIMELIESRLLCSKDQKSNDYNGDNRFYWRQFLQKSEPYEL